MQRILDVGNCDPDHAAICDLVKKSFQARVDRAEQLSDALEALRREDYALVLVNRKLDCDYSDGLDVIRAIKRHAELGSIPVMMITNFPEHQAAAVAEGAEPGFGKNSLGNAATVSLLAKYLSTSSSTA